MRDISELANAVENADVFSEARAILDYSCSMQKTCNWIISHERLRRDYLAMEKQRDALQKQVASLLAEQLEMQEQVQA